MKLGFEIQIQTDLTDFEKESAIKFADSFIKNTLNDLNHRYGGTPSGGYTSFYKRGTLGKIIPTDIYKNETLTFKRISNNKRIFGIVKIDELKPQCPNIKDLRNICRCPKHSGQTYVTWKTKKPTMMSYYITGDVNG